MPGVPGKRSQLWVGLDQLALRPLPTALPPPGVIVGHITPAVIKAATVFAFSALLREGRINEPSLARGQGSSRPQHLETLSPKTQAP